MERRPTENQEKRVHHGDTEKGKRLSIRNPGTQEESRGKTPIGMKLVFRQQEHATTDDRCEVRSSPS
jgi:hypothetical protein